MLWPDRASEYAGRTDALMIFLIAVTTFFTVAITIALFAFAIRYRRRPGRRAEPATGSMLLELAWIGGPLVIVFVSFGWGAKLYFETLTPPGEAMEIYVTGKQWMWKVQHPTGHREINSLHVPRGRPVLLTMTSEDVIHSFYIPALRIKRDTVPGIYTQVWFEADRPGEYHLFCAEYCGTKHSEMGGKVTVMEPADYERWLAGRTAELPPAEAGKVLFESLRCVTCHAAGTGQKGPDLAGRWGRAAELEDGRTVLFDADYVRESILDPRAKVSKGYEPLMPPYRGQVTEGQILQIVAYLKSIAEEESTEAPK